MNLDDPVCYCFHVSWRKLVNWCRRERPLVASQLSECGGAGTGCGWCIPFLKKIFRQQCKGAQDSTLDELSSSVYAAQRAAYIRSGRGTLPGPSASKSESLHEARLPPHD